MPESASVPPEGDRARAAKPRLKDVDSGERARHIFAAAWLVPWLLIIAGAVAYFLTQSGVSPLVSVLVGLLFLVAGLILYFGLFFAGIIHPTAAFLGDSLYGGGTTGTPHPETYWRAEALSARGQHREALDELELAVADNPDDPRPCLMAAKICAQELRDPTNAAAWYRKARQVAEADPELAAYVTMRLAQVYEDVGEPGRAAVELRRLLVQHPESKYAAGARSGLARLKQEGGRGGAQ